MPVDYSALKINAKLKTNVGIFKLADETQMGGLNSLMVQHQNSTNNNNNNTDHTKNLMQDLKADLDQGKFHLLGAHSWKLNDFWSIFQ